MKLLIILALLLSPAVWATSYKEPEPQSLEAGQYALIDFRQVEKSDDWLESGRVILFSKDENGNLRNTEKGVKIAQFEDYFVITESIINKDVHVISTYIGSLRARLPTVYRGTYTRVIYLKGREAEQRPTIEQGKFMFIGKITAGKN
jgi:hypothetical protein